MNTNQPLVSIIIPTYNRAHLIGETLDSVLAQTYSHWECIVVDDGSTDHTEELLKTYISKDSRFQYHKRPDTHKPGGNGARNYGFEVSKGDYINWFDSDDLMLEENISERIPYFKEDVVLVIASGYYANENLDIIKPMFYDENLPLFEALVRWKSEIITNSVFVKKSFLLDKKLFNIHIHRGQETEFFSRLFFQLPKENYRFIDKFLFLYRQHEITKSTKEKEGYNSEFNNSRFIIAITNFKRCMEIKDKKMMNFFHKQLMMNFFENINFKNYTLSYNIINRYSFLVSFRYFHRFIEFLLLGNLMCIMGRESYKIKKRWLNLQY